MSDAKAVDSDIYTDAYYAQQCGGAEFFRVYGPKVVKPSMAYALKRARLAPGMSVLDVGCGRGEILYQARAAGAFAAGADFAQAALRVAASTSQAPVLRCDAKRLPFAEKTFDRIFFLGVLDHLHDWELKDCFSEFKRVLRPEGFVVATTCTNTDYYGPMPGAGHAKPAGAREPAPPRSGTTKRCMSTSIRRARWKDSSGIDWEADVEPLTTSIA